MKIIKFPSGVINNYSLIRRASAVGDGEAVRVA